MDIVERLRTRYKVMCRRCQHFNCDMTTPHEVMDAAADEIERLRKLAEVYEQVGPWRD